MATIEKREDLNNQPHKAAEKVAREGGVRALVASDLPPSEVIGTLTKRVRESRHQKENYSYLLPKLFGRNMVFDGLIDINYSEMIADLSNGPYEDVVIEDFSSGTNKALRFTYEAKTQSNYKTKILREALFNFKTNPGDGITSVFKETDNLNKAQMMKWAELGWTALNDKAVFIDCVGAPTVATDGDSIAKTIYTTLLDYTKNSKSHLGVGNGALPGEITKGTDTINPTYKFESKDFYLLETPGFQADVEMDGNRVLFNWQGKTFEVAGRHTLHLTDEEMPSAVATAWADAAAVLVHKNAIYGIQDWEGTGEANAGKMYTVIPNYMKQDPVPLFDAPVIVFNYGTAPVAVLEAEKVYEAEPTVENRKVLLEAKEEAYKTANKKLLDAIKKSQEKVERKKQQRIEEFKKSQKRQKTE